jgi:hypothetical protein
MAGVTVSDAVVSCDATIFEMYLKRGSSLIDILLPARALRQRTKTARSGGRVSLHKDHVRVGIITGRGVGPGAQGNALRARARELEGNCEPGQHDDQQKSTVEATVVVSLFLVGKLRAKCVGERIKLHLG